MKTDNSVENIIKNGTVRQKAVLLCINFLDQHNKEGKTLLTKHEAEAIKDSIKEDNEKRELKKWIAIFNTYTRIAQSLGLAYAEYRANANAFLVSIRQWEDYCREENHLNYILNELRNKGNADAIKTFYDTLDFMKFPFSEVLIDNDGFVNINVGTPEGKDNFSLYKQILRGRETVIRYLATLKAIVIVIEEWTEKKKSKAIMPPYMAEALKASKEDYSLVIAPTYSEHLYNLSVKDGEKQNQRDKLKALYPDYDTVEINKDIYDYFKEQIEDIYESERG